MAFGDEGVTKLQYKQDSTTPWGPSGISKTVTLTKAGILKNLRMIQGGGALSLGAGAAASAFGPYNAYAQLELLANAQQDIFRTSGIGMSYIDMIKRGLEDAMAPINTAEPSPPNVTDTDYIFDGRATSAPANNTQWNWYLNLPVSQKVRSLGGDIGMIPMATENAQMQFLFTPNAASVSGTTYTISNGSASDDLSEAYYGTNATTISAPTVDLVRIMYEAIQNPADFPDFSFVSQWLEEQPQTFSGTTWTWKQNQDAGVLARLIFATYTSAAPWGITTANLPAANAIQLSYNTDTAKFKETGLEALARQRDQLGFDLPYGVFFYDLLGKDLTQADVLNSYVVPAIQLQMNYNAVTLNTNVNPKVLAQRFLPIKVA
ncbi:MAG TPA: hypothetical protein VNG51_16920 [Ktedonobacteraceae bacterium]|nr:hypothetical protein [Ktedonobacteraceae bacterium]